METWPRSSWTTRMSAPWASMWVAQEWRSTWGWTRSSRPAGRARFLSTPQTPCRVSRPPRAFRNTASASPRRAQRRGSNSGRPPGAEPVVEGPAGAAAHGHEALLVPLAEDPDQAGVRAEVGQAAARPAPTPASRCRRGPRGWPGRGRRPGRRRWSCRAAPRPRPRRWPWAAAAASAGVARRRWGRRRRHPPRAGSGAGPAAAASARATDAGPSPAARRSAR